MNVALLTFSLKKRNETKRRKWMKSDKRRAQKLILYSEIYFFFPVRKLYNTSRMETYSQRLIDIHIIIILLIEFDFLISRDETLLK
jgi:hypothetical protein